MKLIRHCGDQELFVANDRKEAPTKTVIFADLFEMACVVPSRFAKLKIVEDDFVAAKLKQEKIQARHKEAELAKLNQKDLSEKKVKSAKTTKVISLFIDSTFGHIHRFFLLGSKH